MPEGTPEEQARIPGAVFVTAADGSRIQADPRTLAALGMQVPEQAPSHPEAAPDAFGQAFGGAPLTATGQRWAEQIAREDTTPAPTTTAGSRAVSAGTMHATPAFAGASMRGAPVDLGAPPQQQPAPEQPQQGDQMARLAQMAAGGDMQASRLLIQAGSRGDPAARQLLGELATMQQAGVLQPRRRGRGGPRVTQTSTSRQQGLARPLTPEEQSQLGTAQEQQASAEQQQLRGLTDQYEAEAGALRDSAAAHRRGQVELEAMQAEQATEARARESEFARRSREVDAFSRQVAGQQIDSNRIFGNGQTGARISAGIGLALGFLGDALTGGSQGSQTVLGIINGFIDRDIQEQQTNLAAQQGAVADARGGLRELRAKMGDDDSAAAALKAGMLAGVARQVAALQEHAQGTARSAQLQQLLGQIEAQRAAAQQAAVVAGAGTSEIVTESRQRQGGGGGRRPVANFGAFLADDAGDVTSSDRAALQERQGASEELHRVISRARGLLDGTTRTGPLGDLLPGSSSESRELSRLLSGIARPFVQAAMGAATPEQIDYVESRMGLTMDTRAEDLEGIFADLERQARDGMARAELSVAPAAVREAQRRDPGVRQRVAIERAPVEQVVPGFRRDQ